MRETPLLQKWRFLVPALVTGLQIICGRWFFAPCHLQVLRPVIPFEGRFVGGGSCRILLFLWLAGILSSSRFITGTFYIAIHWPFMLVRVINKLRGWS